MAGLSSKKTKGNTLHTVLKNGSDSYEEFMNGLESVAGGTQDVADLAGPHTPIVVSGQVTPTSGHAGTSRFKEADQGQGQLDLNSGPNTPQKGQKYQNTSERQVKKSRSVVSVIESEPEDGVSVEVCDSSVDSTLDEAEGDPSADFNLTGVPIANNSGNDIFVRLACAASAHKSMLHKTKRHIVGTKKVKWSPPGHRANCSRFDSVNVSEREVGYRSGVPNRHSGDLIEGDEEELHSIERHLVIEKKKNELLRLKRKYDSLAIDNVSVRIANCVPNNVFDIDYGALELENLQSNKSLVQRATEQMGNLGLFAERDQQSLASSQLEGGKINNNYSLQANSEKLQSGTADVVSSSIKSKLIWPQSKLKLSHANKKYKF